LKWLLVRGAVVMYSNLGAISRPMVLSFEEA